MWSTFLAIIICSSWLSSKTHSESSRFCPVSSFGLLLLGIEVKREDVRELRDAKRPNGNSETAFRGTGSLIITFGRFIENTMQNLRWEYLAIIGDRNLVYLKIEREGWARTVTIHDE